MLGSFSMLDHIREEHELEYEEENRFNYNNDTASLSSSPIPDKRLIITPFPAQERFRPGTPGTSGLSFGSSETGLSQSYGEEEEEFDILEHRDENGRQQQKHQRISSDEYGDNSFRLVSKAILLCHGEQPYRTLDFFDETSETLGSPSRYRLPSFHAWKSASSPKRSSTSTSSSKTLSTSRSPQQQQQQQSPQRAKPSFKRGFFGSTRTKAPPGSFASAIGRDYY
jgi:hypothetical protein